MTEITSWGHSCIRLERDGRRLVLDPGSFSDLSVLDDADAVLVTHGHPDHLDPARLVAAVGSRPALRVWAHADVVEQLVGAGADAERVRAVAAGDVFEAAGFDVRALGAPHAVIHPDVAVPANLAFLVDGAVLHPGDALDVVPTDVRVDVLLVPVAAPWLKLAEAVDYVRAVAPRVAVPIHDAILNEVGRALCDRLVGGLGGADEYRRIVPGEPYTYATPAA